MNADWLLVTSETGELSLRSASEMAGIMLNSPNHGSSKHPFLMKYLSPPASSLDLLFDHGNISKIILTYSHDMLDAEDVQSWMPSFTLSDVLAAVTLLAHTIDSGDARCIVSTKKRTQRRP